MTIEQIELLTKNYAAARAELAERMNALREEQEAAKRRRMQGIKNSLDRVQASYTALEAAITEGRALFEKPKTRLFHAIKVGWQKQKGKVKIADKTATIAALRKHLGIDEAKAYIKTTEKPIATALAQLSGAILKKCGITVDDDGDAVLIKAQDDEIDKLVDALLGKAADAEADE